MVKNFHIFHAIKREPSRFKVKELQQINEMKKLTFIMLLLVATVSALAQPEPGTWTITPRVGVNSSDVSGVKIYYADPFAASYDSDAYVNSNSVRWLCRSECSIQMKGSVLNMTSIKTTLTIRRSLVAS
jgi:hypothetical protein